MVLPKPRTLPPLDDATLADLRQRYDATSDADLRLRYQLVLLAHQGRSVRHIATLVLRSHDPVTRLLNRFRSGGLDAVPRRTAPGGPLTLTAAWVAALLRGIARDPHDRGVTSANGTTGLRATYLAEKTGMRVSDETVRTTLHAHGSGCTRPTWSLKRKAEEQDNDVGNACGWRCSWPGQARPPRHRLRPWLPPTCATCSPLTGTRCCNGCRARMGICRTKSHWSSIRP